MYKGRSRGLHSRVDRGLTSKNGRTVRMKTGKARTKKVGRLESTAGDFQLASWRRYVETCRKNGTTPFVPADIRRKLNTDN